MPCGYCRFRFLFYDLLGIIPYEVNIGKIKMSDPSLSQSINRRILHINMDTFFAAVEQKGDRDS
jgi:hypothetical protein